MTKLETLVVPTDLGEWLQSREMGKPGVYFSTIDALYHYWDTAPDTSVFDFISRNKKELIEVILGVRDYEVEEPLYHALIKGHELMVDKGDWTFKYWKSDTSNGRVFPSHRLINHDDFLTEMSKSEWNELGINDSNADFIRVDGVIE